MISKVRDLIAVGEKLDEISGKVRSSSKEVAGQSREISALKEDVAALRSDIKRLCEEHGRSAEQLASQVGELRSANEDLRKELYDFRLVKADIRSNLVSGLAQDFRDRLREEIGKFDTDVKRFNELKDELSSLVAGFRSVEGEIRKFREISSGIKAADFELVKHAKSLEKADSEKLRLMQKIDHLERLVSKMRRGSR